MKGAVGLNWFEAADFVNWKKLNDEEKKEVFGPLMMYFVHPLLQITGSHLESFELCGMKCRTFQMRINGEEFVFIPGQKDVILGWDSGTKGLKVHELLDYPVSKHFDDTQYGINLDEEDLMLLEPEDGDTEDRLDTVEGLDFYINDSTTLLRKVDLPPMLVSTHSIPVGCEFKGTYNCVTGEFQGDQTFFSCYQQDILHCLQCETENPLLNFSYEKSVLEKQKFYLEQIPHTDSYSLYAHEWLTYQEQKERLEQRGFDFLTEDQWEYAIGGGTRRLFRWGNEVSIDPSPSPASAYQKMRQKNMFGLSIDCTEKHYELTTDPFTVKLGRVSDHEKTLIKRLMPLSSYYQSYHQLKIEQKLDPEIYSYRKVIVLEEPKD